MNILIIEDEYKIAMSLKEMIETDDNYRVFYICQTIEASVLYLTENQDKIDLIFMDIELSDGKSFDIFNQINIIKPVVFCTAYSEYMFQAFKNNGIDYLLKPFSQDDIDAALKKTFTIKASFSNLEQIQPIDNDNSTRFPPVLISRYKEKIIPVLVQEIAIISLKHGIVYVKTFKGEQSIISKTVDEIELILHPNDFFRINRQTIIHRKAISHIVPLSNRKLQVNIALYYLDELVVSRLKVASFNEWIKFQ